ncbi:hypothetical protein A2U01_0090203, partial [Trifolium medium]|nr:hypothetical protein [Trifolium medium]
TVSDIEARHVTEKETLSGEIDKLKKAREDDVVAAKKECDAAVTKVRGECAGEMETLKKRHAEEKALLEKEIRLLTLARNTF